jgi:hypothetical protein
MGGQLMYSGFQKLVHMALRSIFNPFVTAMIAFCSISRLSKFPLNQFLNPLKISQKLGFFLLVLNKIKDLIS